MISSDPVRFVHLLRRFALPTLAALACVTPSYAQTPAPSGATPAKPAAPSADPNNLRMLSQDGSLLSIQGGQRLLKEANQAFDAQNYDLAVRKLQEARQVFNQLSNFYQDLGTSFSGIDNRIADLQRRRALDTAQLRDEATYRLALAHRAQNQPELAVPLLIQIIRSQNPTRELGKQAYQQLFELGFVESPFPSSGSQSSSSK